MANSAIGNLSFTVIPDSNVSSQFAKHWNTLATRIDSTDTGWAQAKYIIRYWATQLHGNSNTRSIGRFSDSSRRQNSKQVTCHFIRYFIEHVTNPRLHFTARYALGSNYLLKGASSFLSIVLHGAMWTKQKNEKAAKHFKYRLHRAREREGNFEIE